MLSTIIDILCIYKDINKWNDSDISAYVIYILQRFLSLLMASHLVSHLHVK